MLMWSNGLLMYYEAGNDRHDGSNKYAAGMEMNDEKRSRLRPADL